MNLYLDTETVGLSGPVKLIQYALDDSAVQMIALPKGWENSSAIKSSLYQLFNLIDSPGVTLVAFNAVFDLFKLYTLKHYLMGNEYTSRERPVMPFRCKVLDLQIPAMLKSPLAPFAFNRGAGKSVALLRRIPTDTQEYVAGLVTEKIKPLLPSSFDLAVSVHKVPKQPKLVTLGFNVSGRLSLKGLMSEYGLPTLKLAECWPLPERGDEKPWLPYPDPAIHNPIEYQCDIVLNGPKNSAFYRYSELDILYLKVLYEKLGKPEPDYNSDCVANMAYLRYYGFDMDRVALKQAEEYYGNRVSEIETRIAGCNLRSSTERLALLKPYFPILASTSKKVLATLADDITPGGKLCASIVEYGPARQRLLQLQKVLECQTMKAHPSLRVMGTATNRMAGEAGLNWQGIPATEELDELEDNQDDEQIDDEVEESEPEEKTKIGLRQAILTPCVGDWSSFEVVIAAQVYNDRQLQQDLRNGVDLHSMVATTAHPKIKELGMSYEEFKSIYDNTEHPQHSWVNKIRKQIKAVVFGSFYFASGMKVAEVLGLPEFQGQQVIDDMCSRYQGLGRYRADIERRFITADTEHWRSGSISEMEDSVADLTGFERHWNFEKGVAIALWELGTGKRIKCGLNGTVTRTVAKGPQSLDMAITSACLGSAIAMQAAVSRQAGNMKIQATGSSLTKKLLAIIWEKLRVPCLNIHDELLVPQHPNFNMASYSALVDEYVKEAQATVPMLKFKYGQTERWSDK